MHDCKLIQTDGKGGKQRDVAPSAQSKYAMKIKTKDYLHKQFL
jgi:hypothetical protein